MTDEAPDSIGKMTGEVASGHGTVNHAIDEYVRAAVSSTPIVSRDISALLKRGITGTYHHVIQQHLNRYLAEFDFRYNNRIALGVDDATPR